MNARLTPPPPPKRRSKSTPKLALPAELSRFVTNNKAYLWFHRDISDRESIALLNNFLYASLDEVRLHHADRYANLVLKLTDLEDARHFRQGVLRREVSGDIEYQKQRDHAAHTLHNYLLGWYIYENNEPFRREMCNAMDFRLPRIGEDRDREDSEASRFGNIWPYASLLHDVGYLFEGGLEALHIGSCSERVRHGAEITEEYFRNGFWIETPLAAATERERVRNWTGITPPDFAPYTISAVGDSLRVLGKLETLWGCICEELKDKKIETNQLTKLDFKGQGDAFNVWRQHYNTYSPAMCKRVTQMQTAFYSLIWDGLPGLGVRVLDHGVSGGLLLLRYATYYYQMHFGVISKANEPNCDPEIRDLEKRIKERVDGKGFVYDAYWWWTSIVWVTAATALHNLQQQESPWPGCQDKIEPLSMKDDPLAYLGILVDVLQEWDRYTISRASIFTGKLPLQGKDVKLSAKEDIIEIDYSDAKRAQKVKDALDSSLEGWRGIVAVLPS